MLLSETFSALADPTRRAILARLAHGEATVNELAEPFPVSLQAVSKHLKVLERAGLITRGRTRSGDPAGCGPRPLGDVTHWLEDYRRFWEQSFDRLDEHLRADPGRSQDMSDATPPRRCGLRAQRCGRDHDRPGLRRAAGAGLQGVDRSRALRDLVRRARLVDPARQGVDGRPARRRVERHHDLRPGRVELPFSGRFREVVEPERVS